MTDTPNKEQLHGALFMNLVLSFHSSAMTQMGKTKNPLTDKIERDMEQARMSIDMLDMLENKTANNLTHDESEFLARIINEVKLNFVDEVNKEQSPPKSEGEKSAGDETGKEGK
ncbi:MAG: DUF1844 domain-containing protein [Actinobacteria bacterium]|nr:DUF1844 domain-containing protein [Actinomycetota bacterium]